MLLLALLGTQTGDIDTHDHKPDYETWIGKIPAGAVPRPERRELALVGLYDVLHYSHSPSAELGLVLAALVSHQPIANPANDSDVKSLRRDLRQGMITEFHRLRGAYP